MRPPFQAAIPVEIKRSNPPFCGMPFVLDEKFFSHLSMAISDNLADVVGFESDS